MLDCQATPGNENSSDGSIECKYCQESGECLGADTIYWGIKLDQDLLDTLLTLYPEWFKDHGLSAPPTSVMACSASANQLLPSPPPSQPGSPTETQVDETPIQNSMDRHKESLKVKLLLRRPISQLVDQGIIPSLKGPPAFHQQRQKLERAKMGDMLKNKIQRRPDREELIQQHILEDSNIDPSLQDKQRQLKKARLADDLNERLSHRPGPLELIKGNILEADEVFARAVKDGQIPFKRTCEGETRKHQPLTFAFEDESSSEGSLSPQQDMDQSQSCAVHSPPNVSSGTSSPVPISSAVSSHCATPVSLSSMMDMMSPGKPSSATALRSQPDVLTSLSKVAQSGCLKTTDSPRNSSSRKKSKSKSAPKTRTIKFHEYKGPPNAQKINPATEADVESSYELLLQQQQLFLQWQLELQHKYPQIILPASQKTMPSMENGVTGSTIVAKTTNSSLGSATQSIATKDPQLSRCLTKLEDMKVSDLKAELKKRNLPVSGSKPQLIERLKPHMETSVAAVNLSSTASTPVETGSLQIVDGGSLESPSHECLTFGETGSPMERKPLDVEIATEVVSPFVSLSGPPSVASMDVDASVSGDYDDMDVGDACRSLPPLTSPIHTLAPTSVDSASSEEMLRRKIEELQRELQRSQLQLQQRQNMYNNQQQMLQQEADGDSRQAQQSRYQPEVKVSQKQLLQQQLQQKILQHQQQQQLLNLQKQEELENLQQINSSLSAADGARKVNESETALRSTLATLLHEKDCFPMEVGDGGVLPMNHFFVNSHVFAEQPSTKRRGSGSSVSSSGHNRTNSLPNFADVPRSSTKPTKLQFVFTKPPPDYREATKQLNHTFPQPLLESLSLPSIGKKSVKSQAVDDVLEILIKNGELPPSAAQEPPTPPTPKTLQSNLNFNSAQIMAPLAASLAQDSVMSPKNTFDVDLALDLEALEPMNIEMLNEPIKSEASSLSPPHTVNGYDGFGSDGSIHMDVDMGDVSRWLDVLLPVDAPSSLGSCQPSGQYVTTSLPPNIGMGYSDSNDPLLSANQDLFGLFSLDEDMKATGNLGSLSWDKVDFTI